MSRPRSKPEARRRASGALLICLPAFASLAWADGAAPNGLVIQPRLELQTLLTDNNTLSATNRDAALVTTVSPGISISSRGGRIVGTLEYSLSGILYAKSAQPDRLQQSLRAIGSAELIENVLTVDSAASISQQAVSALGNQTLDSNLANPNRTEVATLMIGPRLRGRFGSFASVDVRGSVTESSSKNNSLGDLRQTEGSVALNSLSSGQVGWYANLTDQRTAYPGYSGRSDSAQAWFGLNYRPDIDFSVALNGGRERSNYQTGSPDDSVIYGGNFNWAPSLRTKVSGDWMRHSYGNSHSLMAEYRLARSAFRYTDTQAVNQTPQLGVTGLGSAYDIFFSQFASIYPDPGLRDQKVREFLTNNGISADSQLLGRVLTNTPVIARQQQLTYSITGVRTTLVLTAQRSVTDRVGSANGVGGDLGLFQTIVQRGVTVTLAHQLTPNSSAGLGFSLIHSGGEGGSSTLGNDMKLRVVSANWNSRIAIRTSFGLVLRRADADGVSGYRENAVQAILTQLF